MEGGDRRDSFGSKESIDSQRRNSKDNTEYIPTRCRITKPIPPKPATNPMQFVKIGPCELYRKAQEQLKKVEEVKSVRQEIRDEAEDWQANLDNWKSSRRKRQEHIIERVVEVKKFEEQAEMEKGRRKSKTFNEILEERKQRKNKLSISLYENDDPNDFSDYGIGGSRSTNDLRMTEEDISNLENANSTSLQQLNQSRELKQTEINVKCEELISFGTNGIEENNVTYKLSEEINDNLINLDETTKLDERLDIKQKNSWNDTYKELDNIQPEQEQYTYESAIQGYRTRVISKTNLNPALSLSFNNLDNKNGDKTDSNPDVSVIVPKGSILKRKELFENDKLYELSHFETTTSRRLSDDFAHSQSLKERLLSLEKFTEQPLINNTEKITSSSPPSSSSSSSSSASSTTAATTTTPSTTTTTNTDNNSDVKNNNTSKLSSDQFVRNRVSMFNHVPNTSEIDEKTKTKSVICTNWSTNNKQPAAAASDRFSSPEPEEFLNKTDNFHRSLDNLTDTTSESNTLDRHQSLEGLEYCHSNYPASNSSTELLVLSSQYGDTDREDSGIHTADVSCSVSQADEPVEDTDLTTITTEKAIVEDVPTTCVSSQSGEEDSGVDSSAPIMSPLSAENVDFVNSNIYPMNPINFDDVFATEGFPLGAPVTALEPPKEKPPPPPTAGDLEVGMTTDESELKRLNSTKRIKKEMRMKRSSFLGIDPEDQTEVEAVEASIRKPPDINSFLQKESRLEKQLYKKTQSSYSEAGDSQDSGVELERGRLSSDTWCSSLPDNSGVPGITHSRQNSEPCTTNSLTSEEDEITKKEREIIELVEKEEKWKNEFSNNTYNNNNKIEPTIRTSNVEINKSSEHINKREPIVADYANIDDDDHSEVLRVEHELLQLEREERERQRENQLFRENRARMQAKTCLKNKRLSLEDISGTTQQQQLQQHHTTNNMMYQTDCMDYRKSMPELQREDYRKSMPELQRDLSIPTYHTRAQSSTVISRSAHVSPIKQQLQQQHSRPPPPVREQPYERDMFIARKPNIEDELYQQQQQHNNTSNNNKGSHPMSRHSLQVLSAAPRSRLVPQDNWIHPKPVVGDPREKYNYNQHWLIQEAEQRRLSEQTKYTTPPPPPNQSWKLTRSEKHLPDSIIQTLTQRVQNKINLSDRNMHSRRMDNVPGHYGAHSPHSVGHALPIHHPHLMMEDTQDKMLSVSGKKKCSYCGNELGRGAAMIIESLCLFYHMDCFKCCVCHVQLGDGLMGTDVRVRNNKLHCHNCYSSDDGVKFSCV